MNFSAPIPFPASPKRRGSSSAATDEAARTAAVAVDYSYLRRDSWVVSADPCECEVACRRNGEWALLLLTAGRLG